MKYYPITNAALKKLYYQEVESSNPITPFVEEISENIYDVAKTSRSRKYSVDDVRLRNAYELSGYDGGHSMFISEVAERLRRNFPEANIEYFKEHGKLVIDWF